ncbi:hypothetical protein GOQ29_10625 [Clostridium sp. D2Q-14]|uniref:hypothetical protein n=1 Tax=Anaeromonas gelatinilytica TaxID=2683194 RepID=UPI00193B8A29|nr:hypothetical protein [Anaeromonas gelatinilytica]MBS4536068.1 hypothetical protein [Anaeromonas gelatinilytica]
MKLNNISSLLNKDILNIKNDIFIKGKLVEKIDNKILIELNNGDIIKAETKIPLDAEIGKDIEFVVKEIKDEVLFLNPKDKATNEKISEGLISKVLKENNLVDTKQNIEIIKGLISLDMKIDKETVLNLIRNIDKLELIFKSLDNKFLNLDSDLEFNEILTSDLEQERIEKIINYNTKEIEESKEVIKNLFELNPNNRESENLSLKENTIKALLFLSKNDMDINIKNLKFTMDIIEGKNFLSSNVQKIEDFINADSKLYNIKEKLDNLVNMNGDFTKIQNEKLIIKNHYTKLTEIINEINEKISNQDNNDIKPFLDAVKEELDFLKNINKNMTFLYYPINLKNEEILEKVYIFNKNKNKFRNDKFKIYFSLNTDNLDKVDIMYEIFQNNNYITFKLKNEDIAEYIRKNKNILEIYLENVGIKNFTINIKVSEETTYFNPLNEVDLNNYIFDARV